MIDRTQIGNIDWVLIALLVLNSALGVLFIYSASQHLPGDYHIRQIIFIVVGFVALCAASELVALIIDIERNTRGESTWHPGEDSSLW